MHVPRRVAAVTAAVTAAAAVFGLVAGRSVVHASPPVIPGFVQVNSGPAGGTVWQGVISDPGWRGRLRPSDVYLPPGFSTLRRYPVLYLLHGMPGSPRSFVDGLHIAAEGDRLIASGAVRPFIAVMPAAGARHYDGEWAGRWEAFVVHTVIPWANARLPVLRGPANTAIGGLSAGGFGAVDIGLRHPGVFGTLEAWSGYFRPVRDGTLRHLSAAALRRYDPALRVRREAALLTADGTRFFLSSGTTHDRWTARTTRAFAAELSSLRLPYTLWLAPGGHDARLWRAQLPAAIVFAEGEPARLAAA
jgi:enterochelin esterase-like enzyme